MNAGSAEHQIGNKRQYVEEKNAKLGLGAPGDTNTPKGWYSRGYLPHYDSAQKIQSITFRLADSLPQEKLRQLEDELEHLPESEREMERRKKIEQWLDAGMGCCALGHPELAAVMQDTLRKWDGERYSLIAWCVMPNHVHVLIEAAAPLAKIVQSWKSYTGRWALAQNAELGLGVPGKHFWMREYWDRYIRNGKHFEQVVRYIHDNPVKAGLCSEPKDWRWSSAWMGIAGNAEPRLGNKESAKMSGCDT
jgi:REP element-mobilizing transposase RayT